MLPSLRSLDTGPRILLYRPPTDMRKGFDSLAQLVQSHLQENPLGGELFLFHCRRGCRLKILYWDRDGFALWYKRLEKGTFHFPKGQDGQNKMEIKASELAMLLEGIDLKSIKYRPRYRLALPEKIK